MLLKIFKKIYKELIEMEIHFFISFVLYFIKVLKVYVTTSYGIYIYIYIYRLCQNEFKKQFKEIMLIYFLFFDN